MNLGEEVNALLTSAGYDTRTSPADGIALEFEDEAILGFVVVYESVDELLRRWKASHDAYIRSRVAQVRDAADKRSNMYAVFLTPGASQPGQSGLISAIEENFVGSRKIVGTELVSEEVTRSALVPLLPLRVYGLISESDLERRLSTRLQARPGLYEKLFSATGPEDLARQVVAE